MSEEPTSGIIEGFDWDPIKAASNLEKHGVSFVEAVTAFEDEYSETFYDPDHSDDEDRFITIGLSARSRLLLVAHTMRGTIIRIISARVTDIEEKLDHAKRSG